MNKDRVNTLIENTDHHTCKIVLSILLSAYAFPVFGAAKSIEHEVAAFQALQKINYISDGSFSGSIAKISVEALSVLVVDLIHQDQRQDIERKIN